MASRLLELKKVSVSSGGVLLLDGLDWTLRRGEQWAIAGQSGSGKTVLAHTLLGRHFHTGSIEFPVDQSVDGAIRRIAIVEQQHRFRNRPGATDLYYQQRFNSADADQTITVEQELAAYSGWNGTEQDWPDELLIRPLLLKPLIQLSNGENKRVQLAIALFQKPEILILDNPFLGLDVAGRAALHTIIDQLAARGVSLLLITGLHELPVSITHIVILDKGRITYQGLRSDLQSRAVEEKPPGLDSDILLSLRERRTSTASFEIAVRMAHTSVRYGNATILNDVNWEVRKGERWSISGPNGAGKSTILSLITADNPQAYANEIWLFDRRRGTGESIWDIKSKIGFVSPELHLYFDYSAVCFDVIASGLFDTIGLFRPLSFEQTELVGLWIRLLDLQDLRGLRLQQLSTGQQRMVLLARALIKNPPLLILDEPCQGLDEGQTAHFRSLVDQLCNGFDTTLLYVSHYSQELPACVNKFLRLEKGTVLAIS